VLLVKFLPLLLAVLACVFSVIRISLFFRARAMRALAARFGLHYVGPASIRWKLPFPKIKPPIHIPFSLSWWPADEIRQVWNVIEGQQSGVPLLIFDSYIAGGRGSYRTFFACKAEQNRLELDTWRDRVIQSQGWTILYRVPFPLEVPWATWSLGITHLEDHLNTLRVGSGVGT
jgi:hypothetical protein